MSQPAPQTPPPLIELADVAAVAGLVLVTVGVGLIFIPAGLIVCGALLLAAGVFPHVRTYPRVRPTRRRRP